jgi:hypothetical protein
MRRAILLEEPDAVRSRLLELGIPDPEILREVVAESEAARLSFHKNVPGMAVGCAAWGVAVGELRNRLSMHGWTSSSEGRLETTLNATTRVAIAVTSGDEATGGAQQTPKTKHKKGVATEAAIEENVQQLSLLSILPPNHPSYEAGPRPKLVVAPDIAPSTTSVEGDVPDGVILWVLLKARVGDEIRCELSLPAAYGIDGYVNVWAERIILKPIELDGARKAVTPVEPTPSIEVSVKRRPRVG